MCNMSNVKQLDYGLWMSSQKKDIRRLKHYEINFEVIYEGHPNYSKTDFMNILRDFGDHHM